MVSLENIHIIGSLYMSVHGGFKPRPYAIVHYIKKHKLPHKKLFFLGNRLVDMELADNIKSILDSKIFKCLILRKSNSLGVRSCDVITKNLKEVLSEINKFKPDLVLSDFDNTLVRSSYSEVESIVEKLKFWERYGGNKFLRFIYGLFSQFSIPFIKRYPYDSPNDSTKLFLKKLKCPIIIHTMSPELAVEFFLENLFSKSSKNLNI